MASSVKKIIIRDVVITSLLSLNNYAFVWHTLFKIPPEIIHLIVSLILPSNTACCKINECIKKWNYLLWSYRLKFDIKKEYMFHCHDTEKKRKSNQGDCHFIGLINMEGRECENCNQLFCRFCTKNYNNGLYYERRCFDCCFFEEPDDKSSTTSYSGEDTDDKSNNTSYSGEEPDDMSVTTSYSGEDIE